MKYRNNLKRYIKSGAIDQGDNINAITFINVGTSVVTINRVLKLNPPQAGAVIGDSLEIAGNEGEIDLTNYRVDFATGVGELVTITKEKV